MLIPGLLQKNIISIFGNEGKKWLDNLPNLLLHCEQYFQIKLATCFPNLTFHYVAPALLTDGRLAVLKCGIPNDAGIEKEVNALRHFSGEGCVQLLNYQQELGAMLLEKADPGKTLEILKDLNQATSATVAVMQRLHKPVADLHLFDNLKEWFTGLDKFHQYGLHHPSIVSIKIIEKAQSIRDDLLSTMTNNVLLHGDLHYGNILSSEAQGWIAIDPKGVIGEPEFEIPLPPLGEKLVKETLQYHLDLFIEIADYDKKRVIDWLFIKAILAAWWSLEDNGVIHKRFIECAEIVSEIK